MKTEDVNKERKHVMCTNIMNHFRIKDVVVFFNQKCVVSSLFAWNYVEWCLWWLWQSCIWACAVENLAYVMQAAHHSATPLTLTALGTLWESHGSTWSTVLPDWDPESQSQARAKLLCSNACQYPPLLSSTPLSTNPLFLWLSPLPDFFFLSLLPPPLLFALCMAHQPFVLTDVNLTA